jgi:SAM-dependent methyltransferase
LNSIVNRGKKRMRRLDSQIDYWNRLGPTKRFHHPVNFDRLGQQVASNERVLDYGCGYGRVLGLLHERGYRNLIGVDPASEMVAEARRRFPAIRFEHLAEPPRLDMPANSVGAVLLFTVLTCVPSDDGQLAIIGEICRVLRPGGLLYISDLLLQADARNAERYAHDQPTHGTYGVFDLPEGATMRHHDPRWIETLTSGYEAVALDTIEVQTMNGHPAVGFQWFGLKPRAALAGTTGSSAAV